MKYTGSQATPWHDQAINTLIDQPLFTLSPTINDERDCNSIVTIHSNLHTGEVKLKDADEQIEAIKPDARQIDFE